MSVDHPGMNAASKNADSAAGVTDDASSDILYRRSGAAAFGLSYEQFAAVLERIGSKYAQHPSAELYAGLHLTDLALAHACAQGSESAWEYFLARYREQLYSTAIALARQEAAAHEVADLLIGDLFGTSVGKQGARRSKLALYTGRGSLEGWLRATLTQSWIDYCRSRHRLVPFNEDACLKHLCVEDTIWQSGVDQRVETALEESLLELAPESRFILRVHFLDGATLGEIGAMLGLHESTVSRRVGKLTKQLRKSVLRKLKNCGMSGRDAEEVLRFDVRRLALNVRQLLSAAQAIRE